MNTVYSMSDATTANGLVDVPDDDVGLLMTSAPKMTAENVDVYYGDTHALHDVSIDIYQKQITALIGPSGCGKSTFLRCLNRMNDVVDGCRVTGTITLDGKDIHAADVNVVELRSHIGMVFQKPNPFPKSVFENIAYGPRIHGLAANKAELDEIVETSLIKAGLWDEVKEWLDQPGTGLSGGQQQRLCIARAIAVGPEVILMDEPCSALDPIATGRIEDLIHELKRQLAFPRPSRRVALWQVAVSCAITPHNHGAAGGHRSSKLITRASTQQ